MTDLKKCMNWIANDYVKNPNSDRLDANVELVSFLFSVNKTDVLFNISRLVEERANEK